MSSTKNTPEQIYQKLISAEALLASGASLATASEKLTISSSTLKRWRKLYRGMNTEQIQSALVLAKQNRELRRELDCQQVEGRMLLALGKC